MAQIRTTYYGAGTRAQGSRIVAEGMGRSVTIGYPHEARDAHETAARRLAGGPVTFLRESRSGRGNVYETMQKTEG